MSEETPVQEALPIKEFKEAVIGAVAVGFFISDLVAKKPIDLNKVLMLIGKLQAGVEGYENIIPQAFDIDGAEGVEVIGAVSAELNLTNENAKELVANAVAALPANLKLYQSIAKLVKGE